jgi:hypothetical protein
VELNRRGIETEFLLFPGEGHELSRSGRPKHRLARLEHVLRWWARWLPTAANPTPERVSIPVGGVSETDSGEPMSGEPLSERITRV